MKIHKKPKSRMSAIKDRVCCIPIDSDTVMNTLNQLPRLPKDAALVPIKLKRKKSYKNSHLQEWVNVEKLRRCLKLLKEFGHQEYQFYSEESTETYIKRCKEEDPEGYTNFILEDDEYEMSIDEELMKSTSPSVNQSINIESENDEMVVDDPDTFNTAFIEKEVKEETVKPEPQIEPLDEIEKAEKEEEHYRTHDAARKFQFDHDEVAAFVNDNPGICVSTHNNNEAISVSPGEGDSDQ